MTTIKLVKYGVVLTGRAFGAQVFRELEPHLKPPVTLDFQDVVSLGSSFGDKVVPPIAKKQGDKITVINANKAIQKFLRDVAEDGGVEIEFS